MTSPQAGNRTYLSDDPRNIDFKELEPRVRIMQIIVAALAMGVVFFVGVALINFKGFADQLEVLNWLGLGFAVTSIPLSFIIPSIVCNSDRATQSARAAASSPSSTVEQQLGVYQVHLIIGCAILEGAAFLNGIAFQTIPHLSSLIAVAICIAFMLARFPTKWKVQNWLANRLS